MPSRTEEAGAERPKSRRGAEKRKDVSVEAGAESPCPAAYAAYLQDPSDAGLERLRAAYEVVPGHLREFLMMPDGSERDLDDAIRALLGYPDD